MEQPVYWTIGIDENGNVYKAPAKQSDCARPFPGAAARMTAHEALRDIKYVASLNAHANEHRLIPGDIVDTADRWQFRVAAAYKLSESKTRYVFEPSDR